MRKRGCLIAKLADTALISVVEQAIQVIAQQEANRLQLLWADRGDRPKLTLNLRAPLALDRDALVIAFLTRGCAAARCAIPVGMTSGASCLSRIWCPCHGAGMARAIEGLDPITRGKTAEVSRFKNVTSSFPLPALPQATTSRLRRELTWQHLWLGGHTQAVGERKGPRKLHLVT